MIAVVDASVALKWFFDIRADDANVDGALALLEHIGTGTVRMLQPPHFLAEMAAVLAREKPEDVQADLANLQRVEWDVAEDAVIYSTAVDLAIRLGGHVFDTLYHATALHTEGATLVTADSRYYRKAASVGAITRLGDLELRS